MIRLTLLLIAALGLAACDTVAGAGQDISKAGTAISTTAHKTQAQM